MCDVRRVVRTRGEGVEDDGGSIDGSVAVYVEHSCQGHEEDACSERQELTSNTCETHRTSLQKLCLLAITGRFCFHSIYCKSSTFLTIKTPFGVEFKHRIIMKIRSKFICVHH